MKYIVASVNGALHVLELDDRDGTYYGFATTNNARAIAAALNAQERS